VVELTCHHTVLEERPRRHQRGRADVLFKLGAHKLLSLAELKLKFPVQRILVFALYAVALLSAHGAEPVDPCTPPNFPLPKFGPARVNVRDLGATGNGFTNDTAAINQAIDECNANGGGDLVFPAGTYAAASIHLKSNVRFLLDQKAVITGARTGYDPPEPNPFDKYQDFGHSHFHNALMWGEKIDNFAIVGGRVNGGHIIKDDDPKGRDIGDKVVSIKSGRNLLFQNVTHETGGHFVYLLNDCENVTVDNVTIKKSRDAVNLVGCRNVQLHNCNFTGCGDDTIALKTDWALGRKISSENIYVWDSYFESACNALQFGAETAADFHNINFWNIRIGRALKAGIGIICADGGVIDGVNYRDVTIKGAVCPISLRIANRLLSGDPNKKIGVIKNVKISNVSVTDCQSAKRGTQTSAILGRAESLAENIVLENVKITYKGGTGGLQSENLLAESNQGPRKWLTQPPAAGLYVRDVKGLILKNVEFGFEARDSRPAIFASEVADLTLDNFKSQKMSGERLHVEKIRNFTVRDSPGLSNRDAEAIDSLKE
jgi:Glycosyl hydrolases family 28